jgi:hypothetical protein
MVCCVKANSEWALDDGAIAIVPDLPNNPTTQQVSDWERDEPKEYRWRIIDEGAESLETVICLESQRYIQDHDHLGPGRPKAVLQE